MFGRPATDGNGSSTRARIIWIVCKPYAAITESLDSRGVRAWRCQSVSQSGHACPYASCQRKSDSKLLMPRMHGGNRMVCRLLLFHLQVRMGDSYVPGNTSELS